MANPVSRKERIALSSIFFALGLVFASWAGRIPELKSNLALSDGQLGASMFCLALGSLISMPLIGTLGARVGTERLSVLFSCAFGVTLVFLALAPTWLLFSLALFAFGFTMGGQDVSMNAHAVHVERDHSSPIMSTLHGMFSVGAMAGGALSALMCKLTVAPLLHFLTVAAVLIPSMILVSSVLVPRDVPAADRTGPIFVLPNRHLLALAVVACCSFIGEGAISDWSAVYLERDLKAGSAMAAMGFAIFSTSMAVCRFAGDTISDKIGAKNVLLFGGLIAAGGVSASLLVTNPLVVLIAYLVAGLGFSCLVPVAFSTAGRSQETSPSIAIAGVASAGYLGFVIAPPIIGFLADHSTLQTALWIIVGLCIVASSMSAWVENSKA